MIVTVDCEGSNYDDDIVGSIESMPEFLDLCIRYGIKVILFMTGEFSKEFFKQDLYIKYKNYVEFGLHIHPENLPKEVLRDIEFSTTKELLGDYNKAEKNEILMKSYDYIKSMGIDNIRYYRGGQFSFDNDILNYIDDNFPDIEFHSHCTYRSEYKISEDYYEKNPDCRVKILPVSSYEDGRYLSIENMRYDELDLGIKKFGFSNAILLTHSYMFRKGAFRYQRDNISEHINIKLERLLKNYIST